MNRDGLKFLESVINILKEAGVFAPEENNVPVIQFEHPLALQDILKLSLEDSEDPTSDQCLREICSTVIKYSVKTGHPHFHNQLYAGADNYALAGAWITEALNTSQYTFEVAPAFTLAEQAVLRCSSKLFGFEGGDGVFCPGGSLSNMYGLVLARYRAFPNVKSEGVASLPVLVAFTSQDSHYSIQKAAHWLGLGTNNLVKVRTDSRGCMIPIELRSSIIKAKDRGSFPLVVNATAGTTVLGAFDPLEEIADICKEFGLWMHVDACWGGALQFSDKYRSVLKGIERADSISWNPHKMLGAPLQCSLFLVRNKGILHNANSAAANYLFQQDKFYDVSYDTGDKSVQCGRKVDAFKLWLMWKARGERGLKLLVENAMEAANYFKDKIKEREGFELVISDTQCTNICFWYIPPYLRGLERNQDWWNTMHLVAPKMKEKMILCGTLMIGYSPLEHKYLKNFFRVVVTCHPPAKTSDMDYIISEIERIGNHIQFDENHI